MADGNISNGSQTAELERLRRENEELRSRTEKGGGHFWVSFFATVLLILFCLVTAGAALASWLHYTALDTHRFIEAVAPLIQDEAVARAVSEEAVNRLFERYDLAKRIEKEIKNLPEPFKSQASTGSAGAKSLATSIATDVLKSNAFQSAWRAILTTAHTEAVKGLRSSGAVRLDEEGQVVLDITDLLTDIKDRLASIGLHFLENQSIPSSLGQVVLYKNSQLGKARTAVNTLDDLFLVLPIGAVILLILGAMVAHDTRRAVMGASIGLMALVVIIYACIEIVRGHFLGQIASAATKDAASAISSHLLETMFIVFIGLLVLSLLTILACVASGPYPWATKMHETVSLRGIRHRRRDDGPVPAGFFTRFAWPLRIAGACAALLLFMYLPWAGVTVVVIICAAYLLLLLAIEFLR